MVDRIQLSTVCIYGRAAKASKRQACYTLPDSSEKRRNIQYEDGIASM